MKKFLKYLKWFLGPHRLTSFKTLGDLQHLYLFANKKYIKVLTRYRLIQFQMKRSDKQFSKFIGRPISHFTDKSKIKHKIRLLSSRWRYLNVYYYHAIYPNLHIDDVINNN